MARTACRTLTFDELNALAGRLTDHADSIENAAAHELEMDLRLAARAVSQVEGIARRLSPALRIELERIATLCNDTMATHELHKLLGGT
jgi:hypothetical protein